MTGGRGQSHCLARNGLGFDPREGRDFLFKKIPFGTLRDSGAVSLVSVQNISRLNPKSFCNAYDGNDSSLEWGR